MGGIQRSRLLGVGFGRQIDVKEKAILMKPLPGPTQKVKERLFVSLLHIFKIHIQPEVSLLQHHLEQLVQHNLLQPLILKQMGCPLGGKGPALIYGSQNQNCPCPKQGGLRKQAAVRQGNQCSILPKSIGKERQVRQIWHSLPENPLFYMGIGIAIDHQRTLRFFLRAKGKMLPHRKRRPLGKGRISLDQLPCRDSRLPGNAIDRVS